MTKKLHTRKTSRESSKVNPPILSKQQSDVTNRIVALSDSDLKRFLIDGYLVIPPAELGMDAQWHADLFQYASHVIQSEGNPGNNILPRIPQLNHLFSDARVVSVLGRLLGKDYQMQPHRFPHQTLKGQKDQLWHKDSFFGYSRPLRHNQVRNVMLMYYPQKTTLDMGPTALRRGTQYCSIDPKKFKPQNSSEEQFINEWADKKWREDTDRYLECEAGSILLIHYDLVHRGTRNDAHERQMYKFQFRRIVEPSMDDETIPEHVPSYEDVQLDDDFKYNEELDPPARAIWNWINNIPFIVEDKNDSSELVLDINSPSELNRFATVYSLGLKGNYQQLISRLYSPSDQVCINAAHGLVACRSRECVKEMMSVFQKGPKTGQSQLVRSAAMFVFSEWGPLVRQELNEKELDQLIRYLLKWKVVTSDVNVRLYFTEALGTIFCNVDEGDELLSLVVERLSDLLFDNNEQIRFTAAISLARIGAGANSALPSVQRAIEQDQNRYVVGHLFSTLERFTSMESMKLLIQYLKASRWCQFTTLESPW